MQPGSSTLDPKALVTEESPDLRWGSWPPYLSSIAAIPLIYAMIVPLAFLDVAVVVYQRLVFPLIGLPRVDRRAYIRLDRHTLGYLDPVQKVGCLFCGYANGVLRFASRVAADTERRFCPIRHKPDPNFRSPAHHADFAPYGNAEAFFRRMIRWAKAR